jgi:PAS domain S-box-containing protein
LDVTLSRRAQVEELFEALLAHGAEPVMLTRPDGAVLRANAAACAALGRPEEEIRRLGRAGLVVPTPELAALVAERERTGKVEGELLFRRPDGSTFPAEFSSTLVSTGGEPVALLLFRDVSARRAAERALREREERARVALETAGLGTWRHHLASDELTFDARGAELYGFPEGTVTTLAEVLARVHPDDARRLAAEVAVTLDPVRGGDRFATDYRVVPPGQPERWLQVQVRVLFEGEGEARRPVLGVGTVLDVTDRKRLEERLREGEERFRAAFQTLPDAVTLTERGTGLFLLVNEGAGSVTGWTSEEMIGRTAEDLRLWADDDRAEFVARLRADGAVRDMRTRLRRKDGQILDVSVSAQPLRVGARDLILTVTRDHTPRLRAERERDAVQAQLRESQKLEALGRLAGGIAHDFNNLLTVVMSCGEALHEAAAARRPAELEDVREIALAAERASDLTRQLLAFARRQTIRPVPLDLNVLLERAARLLRRVLGEDVDLLVDAARGLWTVSADPAQLEQVIVNLALNARDAMPSGGRLLLETGNAELDEAGAARFPGASPGRYVRLAVQDSGTGMTPEVRARAFEPFFTTKPPGKGTGLGLATVHGVVTQSGGFVRLESERGYGTRFELLLPRVDEPPAPGLEWSIAAGTPRPRTGTETVLVVEDDRLLREVMARTLRAGGYRVVTATAAAEAIEVATADPTIAIVVADVVLAEQDGPRVVSAVRARRPAVAALLVSGHDEEILLRRGALEPGTNFLRKPFTGTDLLACVRSALDAVR